MGTFSLNGHVQTKVYWKISTYSSLKMYIAMWYLLFFLYERWICCAFEILNNYSDPVSNVKLPEAIPRHQQSVAFSIGHFPKIDS